MLEQVPNTVVSTGNDDPLHFPLQAIHLAAQAGNADVAGLLIQTGADVNATTTEKG